MASKFLSQKILGQMQIDDPEQEDARVQGTEQILLQDSRKPTQSIANINFKFNKAVNGDEQYTDQLVNSVQDSIASGELDVIQRILASLGMQAPKNQSRQVSQTSTNIGRYSRYRKSKSDTGLRDGKGKFVSEINLRNQLKLATIQNVVTDMKRPSSALQYRTGRFQYSVDLKPLTLRSNTLSIFYTYMVRPYSVFDPSVSQYRGLSSQARNPQKIISDQLVRQATQLGIRRYKLDIKQHWRRTG